MSRHADDPGAKPESMTVPIRLLFVCVENSCRSQMAEAFARRHAPAGVEARSAGSRPSGTVNPKAIASMAEVGCDLRTQTSTSLDELAGLEFDVAVGMGCGDACGGLRVRCHENWDVPDPKYLGPSEFARVRDEIELRVVDLLARLPDLVDASSRSRCRSSSES